MRIYLAGKMDAAYGAWRDALLESEPSDYRDGRKAPYWELVSNSQNGDIDLAQLGVCPWPAGPNRRVLGLHEYVGPYRTTYAPKIDSKYTGYFHGSTVTGQHGMSNFDDHAAILQECWKAIRRSELMVAYVNTPDCFGTFAEIGIAKALGVYVVGTFERDAEWEDSDYWFVEQLCDAVVRVPKPIVVGERPPDPLFAEMPREEWGLVYEAEKAWRTRHDAERHRLRGMLREAIVHWTARAEPVASAALVRQGDDDRVLHALRESASSFAQIARWSADPRVRNEAQRMLRRIAG
jgi:hypothetical protein